MGEMGGERGSAKQEFSRKKKTWWRDAAAVTLSTPEAGDRSREVRAGGRARCAVLCAPMRPSRPRRPSRGGSFLGGAGVGDVACLARSLVGPRRGRRSDVDCCVRPRVFLSLRPYLAGVLSLCRSNRSVEAVGRLLLSLHCRTCTPSCLTVSEPAPP